MRDPSETLGGSSIKAMRVAAVEVQVETEEERLAGGKMGFPGSRIAACSIAAREGNFRRHVLCINFQCIIFLFF